MRKQITSVAVAAYVLLLAVVTWRAGLKYGPEAAGGFAATGLFLLVVLVRVWAYVQGILWGTSRYYARD
jgi:hypothetical protein